VSLWWVPAANEMGGLSPSSTTVGGGGYGTSATGAVQFRDPLDARRSAQGQLGQAEYPDGYLGNIINRRQDRLLQAIKTRQTSASYQRGVHRGSKLDPSAYLWEGLDPGAGLRRESRAAIDEQGRYIVRRYGPHGDPVEVLAHQGKTTGLATPGDIGQKMDEARTAGVNPAANPIVVMDPVQARHMRKMLPRYR
jgi:hypothetical protein